MEILLSNCPWEVQGFWPFVPIFGAQDGSKNQLQGVTDWIKATVPGGVHADLLAAGVIKDPYYELNSLLCEWVENRWWKYRTFFTVSETCSGKHLSLLFKGLDYNARIYLNGRKVGEHEGMFTPVVLDVSAQILFGKENELVVVFESVPDEMSQIGLTSRTRTGKSRFAYKWDWCTRLVNIGIWDDVLLLVHDEIKAEDVRIYTDVRESTGTVAFACKLRYLGVEQRKRKQLRLRLRSDAALISVHEVDVPTEAPPAGEATLDFSHVFRVPEPDLWYPNGIGKQPLYSLEAELISGQQTSWARTYQVGIRRLAFRKNDDASEDSLPYTIVVNGLPVYVKGANVAPFEQMYGSTTEETYHRHVQLLALAHINLVRVNGVGIIEKETFYTLCDKYGIMVWQDFIQSGSGIDNIPSVDPHFLDLTRETAIAALKEKRNHTCLAVWCGGNELMDADGNPISQAHPNISMLADLARLHDPARLFLPSTSSGPNFSLKADQPGRNHDIHGSWKYLGAEKHYAYYNSSDSLLHSEFGAEAMSSIDSLRRFLGEESLTVTDMRANLVWRHHGEWWDCLPRDTEMFGPFERLEDFIKASQFLQAEGLRYIIESNRRRVFRNSGSIVWQYNESWPNVAGTYLVEYFGTPRMAYYWTRDSYENVHSSLRYETLSFPSGSPFRASLFAGTFAADQDAEVAWKIVDVGGNILGNGEWHGCLKQNQESRIAELELLLPRLPEEVFFARIDVKDVSGAPMSRNLYVFSQRTATLFAPLMTLEKTCVTIRESGHLTFTAENTGRIAALFIHVLNRAGIPWIYADRNYCSLFPGESVEFHVRPIRSSGVSMIEASELRWEWFNQ